MKTETKWQAVISNDAHYDGVFVYAIKTTGIYCKPSCKSRTPNHVNVEYYKTNEQAETAGYRACKRCLARQVNSQEIIKKACAFIVAQDGIPKLSAVAAHVGLSPNHFQKIFSDGLGISPRSFSDNHRQQVFKKLLQQGDDISGALYEAGFSSSSRVYEFAHRYIGMTPKAYQQGGKNHQIWYSLVSCALGMMLIAATEKGICSVQLGDDENALRIKLAQEFHGADLIESDKQLTKWTQVLVDYLAGQAAWPMLPYDLKATAFQRKVWDHLRTIPAGQTYNYSDVANALGQPKAARAVARACATNPVALVIPCHRIIPKSGGVGGYRWAAERKQKLLELEQSEERVLK